MTATGIHHPALPDPATEGHRPHGGRPRRRWMVWRSPDDQPAWSRPLLLVIVAFAVTLYAWNISTSGYAFFYSDAVKSMSVSWKAFFYGAFDPGATVTLDKLSGSFLPQALSARIFGFHQWSVTLPQVIEGAISVLVMHRIVRRWAGAVPAILAAAIFAFTPVLASMFGHPMEDSGLTMCLVLAADSYQRAVMEARLRSLLLAGMWVGLGFQAKMMQAWIVLPALFIGYLVIAPITWRRRLLHLLAAGVVTIAVSFSWILLYTLTPANDRPYVDGSSNNSAFAMVFGYNGLSRFGVDINGALPAMGGGGGGGARTAGELPAGLGGVGGLGSAGGGTGGQGAVGQTGTGGMPAGGGFLGGATGMGGLGAGASGTTGTSGSAGTAGTGSAASGGFPDIPGLADLRGGAGGRGGFPGGPGGNGWTKLFSDQYATQIGWLYPLAFVSLAFGLVRWRRRGRTDRLSGGFLMWGTWLVTTMVVFSKMTIPHTAYMATLAPPLAALSATGIVLLWRAYRSGGLASWVLPAAIAAETAWTVYVASDYSSFLPWLTPLVIAAAAVAVVVLLLGRLSRRVRGRVLTGGLVAGVVAMLATPSAWATSVLDTNYNGSAFNATAGPVAGGGLGMTAGSGTLTTAEQNLIDYVNAHRGNAEYVMATSSWETASPYILATGENVLPMGGFSGSVPTPTLAKVKAMVAGGQLKFFLLGSTGGLGGFGGAGGTGTSTVSSITQWVESTCTIVPASNYGGSSSSTGSTTTGGSTTGGSGALAGGGFPGAAGGSGTLYECRSS